MSQALDDSGITTTWAAKILDAFVAEIEERSSGSFLATLDEGLRQVIATDSDIAAWQGVVSIVCRRLLPYLRDLRERQNRLLLSHRQPGEGRIRPGNSEHEHHLRPQRDIRVAMKRV